MSASRLAIRPALLAALVVLLALLGSQTAATQAPALSPFGPAVAARAASSPQPPALTTAQRPLAELLRPDGTLDLNGGYRGSLDPAGWRLAGGGATPRFVPATAPAAPGDEYWAAGFNPSGLDSSTSSSVLALAVDGAGNLYAGGNLMYAGGVSVNYIARWNGAARSSLGNGMSGYVYALAVDGAGNLYAGGGFTTAGGASANYIARWNGAAWSPLGSGMNGFVGALAVDGAGNLYAGGNFTMAGGKPSSYIAQWTGGVLGPVAPIVGISIQGSNVVLTWTQTQAGVARYEVYRSTQPYFTPDGGSLLDGNVLAPGVSRQATFTDPFGEPRVNYYYVVLAVGAGETKSPASRPVGAFHFGLTPGAQ